jgi:hypothetical protein
LAQAHRKAQFQKTAQAAQEKGLHSYGAIELRKSLLRQLTRSH